MSKTLRLLRVCLTQDMNLFKIQSKKASGTTKLLVPLVLACVVMVYMGAYTVGLMEQFKPMNLEYIALSMFCAIFSFVTIFEGFYKASSLLFNCKDDQLLFPLPVSKNIILFIRMFKFYAFEFLFNGMFMAPSMIVYGVQTNQSWLYYLVSIVALVLIPVVPIVISCLFGFVTTYISSKFKGKNLVQTILTMSILLVVLYISFNYDGLLNLIKDNALMIDKYISYYLPVGIYISLINNFNLLTFILYIIGHIALFGITVLIIGKVYFELNSRMKSVSVVHNNKPYVVQTRSRLRSFVKKEFNRFVSTPVFIVNAGFGLLVFVAACAAIAFKYDAIVGGLAEKMEGLSPDVIIGYMPVVLMGLLAFSAFMTSITSSMISLEGKSINILKSLPVKSSMIVLYKVITAIVIMIPCLLLGDFIVIFAFKFNIISVLCILYATILLPFIAELIGIMANLKYPKMDATNDTEIVKQSMSSMVAVFAGMALAMVSVGILVGLAVIGLSNNIILLLFLIIFTIVAAILWLILTKISDKRFDEIQV
ncbi:MAG: hypothetical protein IKP76_03365 [Bacilli bacterium]|nr:hypothetical protein [Bacilli bacterium]